MEYTKWLTETNLEEVELVGGKNASLGIMLQNLSSIGINVPDGFVVTTKTYEDFLKFNCIDKDIRFLINNLDIETNLRCTGETIRNLIMNSSFSQRMIGEIAMKYMTMNNRYESFDVNVAVRSSGSAEDLPEASFAGQQDTYLNIAGIESILKHIKMCFASLFNDRAISYRKSMNYDSLKCKLSCTIQKMVNSGNGSAGVAFSLDINSGFKDIIVINSSFGIGEMVVSGNVKPDEFIVSKMALKNNHEPIINKTMGDKNEMMVFDKEHNGIKTIGVENKNIFSLSENNIKKLAKWVLSIEEFYSNYYKRWCPMDVEWGFDGEELYILQARPETVYSRKNNNLYTQYKTGKITNKFILSGIAIGDTISCGNVKLFNSIDEITNENFNDGDILVTEITDPDWEPIMKRAGAIVTNKGGRTCHAAIVARELGVVSIVGTINATKILNDGDSISVVCCNGEVGSVYDGEIKYKKETTDITNLHTDKVKLMMNLASPELAFKVSMLPSNGIGLLREEFIINNYIKVHPLALINYNSIPDFNIRDEIDQITCGYSNKRQYFIHKLSHGIGTIATAFYNKPVIVRFSDFKSNEYYNLLGGQYFEPHEENPMIGWRGASRYYSKNYKEAFGLECLAIKRVREDMGLKNVIVMLPFVRTVEECKLVLETMEEFGLKRGNDGLKVYIMCEIPSNVICAEEFCQLVDGFSIGSNDLTQLTLGLDRDSELVSNLYNENNMAVKRMIKNVIETCKRNNTKVGICGQGPSDSKEFCEFLIDCGIDTISLTPDSIIKTTININNME